MINYIYNIISFISKLAESSPMTKNHKVRSAIISFIEPYIAIITNSSYNMDNHSTKIYFSLRKHFVCLSTSDYILRFPFFFNPFIISCTEKVFNQKNTRLYYNTYYINMQMYIIFTKVAK